MKEILIIPMDSESYTIPSIGEAVKQLGVSYNALHNAIEHGTFLRISGGNNVLVDIDIDVAEMAVTERKLKYELTSVEDSKVHLFTSYAEVARFIKKGYRSVRKNISERKEYLKNREGRIFRLRVIDNDEA